MRPEADPRAPGHSGSSPEGQLIRANEDNRHSSNVAHTERMGRGERYAGLIGSPAQETTDAAASLRISYLSSAYIPSLSAHSVHVMKMCQAMTQEGHDVELVSQRSSAAFSEEALWRHYGIRDRFPITMIAPSVRFRKVEYDLRSTLRAWRRHFSLIYSRNLRTAAIASTLGWPVVYEAHSVPRGKLGAWYFQRALKGRGMRRVVAISNALKSMLVEEFGPTLVEDDVVVAHDGVDLERFESLPGPGQARAELGIESDNWTVGYAGHLYPGRGIELILELAERLPQINFMIVGGQPESVAERRQELSTLRLPNVRYQGFVANADLPTYLAACDVLLMPYQRRVAGSSGGDISAWLSPMKMFEYMASGRLIISSDLPVLLEVLNDKNAVLCGPEDVDAWERAIRRAMTDTRWCQTLARSARSDVEGYTWRRRVRHVLGTLMGEPK